MVEFCHSIIIDFCVVIVLKKDLLVGFYLLLVGA
jgi:hypothetical protein